MIRPANPIRNAVRKMGLLDSRAIFPSENERVHSEKVNKERKINMGVSRFKNKWILHLFLKFYPSYFLQRDFSLLDKASQESEILCNMDTWPLSHYS